MTDTTIVLTEVPLKPLDVARIVSLHEGQGERAYRVLVPADTERNVVVSVLDHLSLFELKEAWEALKPVDRSEAHADAQEALDTSVRELTDAGVEASGLITEDDPVPTLEAEVKRLSAADVVIVTEPKAVEDTFHTDWASEVRERLGVPVLHVYSGDWRLG